MMNAIARAWMSTLPCAVSGFASEASIDLLKKKLIWPGWFDGVANVKSELCRPPSPSIDVTR